MKVCFKDLSFWLKCGVIGGIAALAVYIIAFLVGFISAL
jgi:hypothetical protein